MLNKIYLVGNVGHAPDIRVMQDGREMASLSLATHSSWKDKHGHWQKNTEWHRITVFADFYTSWVKSNVKKGDSLWIEGKLCYAEVEDKLKNKRRVAHVVIYNREGRILLLNSRKITLFEGNPFKSVSNKNQSSEGVPELGETPLEEIPLEAIPLENSDPTSLSYKEGSSDE